MSSIVAALEHATHLDPTTLFWFALIILGAAFVQGMVGFAFGMIAMALSTLILNAKTASFLVAPLAMVNIATVLWSVRHDVNLRLVAPMVGGIFIGMPFGLLILLGGTVSVVRTLLGVLLVFVAIGRFRHRDGHGKAPISGWWGLLAGTAGGITAGAVNMGGPPLIAYASRQGWRPSTFKATLLSVFMVSSTTKTVALIWHGSLSPPLMATVALIVPVVLLGSATGIRLFERVDRVLFGKLVAGLLLVLGIWILIGA